MTASQGYLVEMFPYMMLEGTTTLQPGTFGGIKILLGRD